MAEFVISDSLAQAFAGYRWRFSRKRLDRTFWHPVKWLTPVSAPTIKKVVTERVINLLLGTGHRGYHQNKKRVSVVQGGGFTEELAKPLRSNLYLDANRRGDQLLGRLAQELQVWLESNDGAVTLQKKHPRQTLQLEADKSVSILIDA